MIPRVDGYLPIEAYAAIGDGGALALVGLDGSIDWMCLPRLDSPSIFGAILDPEDGGRFVVQPAIPFESTRQYIARTNVLQTTFETVRGSVRVTDALTIDPSQTAVWRELVRKVDGVAGDVPMMWRCEPRPEYGKCAPELTWHDDLVLGRAGDLQVSLRTWDAGDTSVGRAGAGGEFTVGAGSQSVIVMTALEQAAIPTPSRAGALRRLDETSGVWRSWVSRHTYAGVWTDAVERSLLAIKLLADTRTGAIAAAGTTSLPEVLRGSRNYDYRFGWVRDLCFTLDALLSVGMDEQTQGSLTWLLQATRRTHPRIDPVYALDGQVVRSQQALPLDGYRRTGPVHLGNQAGSQLQLGGFGDLVETVCKYVSAGHRLAPSAGERLADVGDLLARIWRNEDSGLWELGDHAHYGTSKLGVWVAFDRLLDLVDRGFVPARNVPGWARARDEVRAFIEAHLFSDAKGSYRFKADSDTLDCGMLLAARRRFSDPTGPAMNGTVDAIARELHAGGPLFYRYSGMQDEENAFLACSFWMIEALALAGRLDEAEDLMQDAIDLANDVGLYSEEMEPETRAMRGNLPQALTHLSLIQAAAAIESARSQASARPGRAEERGRIRLDEREQAVGARRGEDPLDGGRTGDEDEDAPLVKGASARGKQDVQSAAVHELKRTKIDRDPPRIA